VLSCQRAACRKRTPGRTPAQPYLGADWVYLVSGVVGFFLSLVLERIANLPPNCSSANRSQWRNGGRGGAGPSRRPAPTIYRIVSFNTLSVIRVMSVCHRSWSHFADMHSTVFKLSFAYRPLSVFSKRLLHRHIEGARGDTWARGARYGYSIDAWCAGRIAGSHTATTAATADH
jgi:hypothetical protein